MPDAGPDDAGDVQAAIVLKALQTDCPQFRIWREITGDRARYISRSRHRGTSPHTVVTDDLTELRELLEHAIIRPRRAPGHAGSEPPACPQRRRNGTDALQ
jgi:hypothetical protein